MRWVVSRAIDTVGPVRPLVTELESTASDALVALWVEDVCWQVQLVDWALRRPPWWRRRDRREWMRHRRELDAAGERLRQEAAGVRPDAGRGGSTSAGPSLG
jgi:hypothetical protein